VGILALRVDSKTVRRPMQKLIDDGVVRTKEERRGMLYYPASVVLPARGGGGVHREQSRRIVGR
jgi:hypothetical protein